MFSILMPAYNEEENVAAAIHSILNQSYRDIELIVVDDGSEDSPGVLLYPPDRAGDEGNRDSSAGGILLYGRRGVIASAAPGLTARGLFSAQLYSFPLGTAERQGKIAGTLVK